MKAESRVTGGKRVFKEKTQHKNLPHAKAERLDGAWGAKRIVSNSDQWDSHSKNPAPLYSNLHFNEHGHICFPKDSSLLPGAVGIIVPILETVIEVRE